MRRIHSRTVGGLIILTCVLSLLSSCASRFAYRVSSLDKPWVKKEDRLIHPDKTIIRFEQPRYYKGRLTGERKDDFHQAITPEKLLASWGMNGTNPVIIRFSKRWEPRGSYGRLNKFVMELDYYSFSSASGFQAGRKMTTKRIVIYRYMGANITNRMGIGIIGYSDRVLAHAREFGDLVHSMSF
ncbi:MAG: hypothetical protein GTO24_21625 [candidate division Zixibacteria bacterium]|nr:hypothetical protein [candidate division Zixibacteria bacterium]